MSDGAQMNELVHENARLKGQLRGAGAELAQVTEERDRLRTAAELALGRLQSPSYEDAAEHLLRALGRDDEMEAVYKNIRAQGHRVSGLLGMSLAETIEGVLENHRASRQLAGGYCVGCGLAYEGFDEHEAHQAEMVEAALGVEQVKAWHSPRRQTVTPQPSRPTWGDYVAVYRIRALESPVLPDPEGKE